MEAALIMMSLGACTVPGPFSTSIIARLKRVRRALFLAVVTPLGGVSMHLPCTSDNFCELAISTGLVGLLVSM